MMFEGSNRMGENPDTEKKKVCVGARREAEWTDLPLRGKGPFELNKRRVGRWHRGWGWLRTVRLGD